MANKFYYNVAKWLATTFAVGYTPASGTVASLIVVIIFYGLGFLPLLPSLAPYGLFCSWLIWLLLITPVAFWSAEYYLQHRFMLDKKMDKKNPKKNDPSEIVIDEVVGQTIALLPVAFFYSVLSFGQFILSLVVSFFLFRLFDIWKPGIIGDVDKKNKKATRAKGSMVMMDDVYAGLLTAILLWPVILLLKGFAF